MGTFEGEVVVVTGGGAGMGRAHALLLAEEGARVVVNDFGGTPDGTAGTSARADSVVAEIVANGGVAVADAHDVSTEAEQIIQTALAVYGAVDGLVNNAGHVASINGDVDEIPQHEFRHMFDVHVLGAIAAIRAAWPVMRERGYGRIVNTSSCATFGFPGSTPYSAAKAALVGLTKSLALDGQQHGITVNAIMPNALTRLNAPSAFGPAFQEHMQPEQVSPLVAALMSARNTSNGEVFTVGGGRAGKLFFGSGVGARFSTVDEVLQRMSSITATDEFTIVEDGMAEVEHEFRCLGVDLASLVQ